jgi:hypothetical protein
MGEDKLYKLSQAFEDWNVDNDDKYDDTVDHLFMAVEIIQDAGEPGTNNVTKDKEYYSLLKDAASHLKKFNKDCVNALKGMKEGLVNESVIGVKTDSSFKPANLQKALDKAKVKYKMNRLSMTLSVLNLDKKYFNDAKKVVDDLGLSIALAKESVNEAKEDYKYKKQVGKAFDKINDAMFNFRHAFGVKQLTNDNMKLKKKFEALQANIFALQREMRSDGLSEGKLTEAKIKKGDIIKMDDGEYGVVNKVSGRVAYIKLPSSPGSFHPIEAARITYKGKHKGKDLYNEGKLNEMELNDPILIAIRARKTMLDKAKSAPKVKKVSMKQYYKLMDTEIDIINDMKSIAKELDQLNSDMLHDAGQKGEDWSDADANRWGGPLDKLQTKYEKFANMKAKVKTAIMNYRIN